MEKKGYVKTRERNGEIVITSINRKQIEDLGITAPKRKSSTKAPEKVEMILALQLYKPSPAVASWISCDTKDFLDRYQIKSALNAYVKSHREELGADKR